MTSPPPPVPPSCVGSRRAPRGLRRHVRPGRARRRDANLFSPLETTEGWCSRSSCPSSWCGPALERAATTAGAPFTGSFDAAAGSRSRQPHRGTPLWARDGREGPGLRSTAPRRTSGQSSARARLERKRRMMRHAHLSHVDVGASLMDEHETHVGRTEIGRHSTLLMNAAPARDEARGTTRHPERRHASTSRFSGRLGPPSELRALHRFLTRACTSRLTRFRDARGGR